MMMRTRIAFLAVALLAAPVVGCALPKSQVTQVDERPLLVVVGAPASARLVVDGIEAGPAADFSGEENALRVLPGAHTVEVVDGGRTLYRKDVFVGAGATKVITVIAGESR